MLTVCSASGSPPLRYTQGYNFYVKMQYVSLAIMVCIALGTWWAVRAAHRMRSWQWPGQVSVNANGRNLKAACLDHLFKKTSSYEIFGR